MAHTHFGGLARVGARRWAHAALHNELTRFLAVAHVYGLDDYRTRAAWLRLERAYWDEHAARFGSTPQSVEELRRCTEIARRRVGV